MSTHALSFARITFLQPHTIEVVIDDGVEVDLKMVDEWRAFMRHHDAIPRLVLLNRVNRYSYKFEALLELAREERIQALAVVYYTAFGRNVVDGVINMLPLKPKCEIVLFARRDEAVQWLALSGASQAS